MFDLIFFVIIVLTLIPTVKFNKLMVMYTEIAKILYPISEKVQSAKMTPLSWSIFAGNHPKKFKTRRRGSISLIKLVRAIS